MKDIHFLYIIVVLAVIGISAIFIGYATGTLPTYTPRQIGTTTAANENATKVEKSCGCCKEDLAKFKEFMEERKRRKAAALQQANAQNTVLE